MSELHRSITWRKETGRGREIGPPVQAQVFQPDPFPPDRSYGANLGSLILPMALLKDDVVRGPEPVADVEIVWNKHIHMFAVAVLFGLIYVRTRWQLEAWGDKLEMCDRNRCFCSFVHFSTVCGVISWFLSNSPNQHYKMLLFTKIKSPVWNRYFGKCVFWLVLQVCVGYFGTFQLGLWCFSTTLTKTATLLCTCPSQPRLANKAELSLWFIHF